MNWRKNRMAPCTYAHFPDGPGQTKARMHMGCRSIRLMHRCAMGVIGANLKWYRDTSGAKFVSRHSRVCTNGSKKQYHQAKDE